MTFRYIERDAQSKEVLWDVKGESLEAIAEIIGMDPDDAENLWAGVSAGSSVIDADLPGKDGRDYDREFIVE